MSKVITIEDFDLTDERVAFVEAKPVGWASTVQVEDFHKALKDAGVPEEKWPKEPTANKCLERAMQAIKDNSRTLVRPLPKGKGWSLVFEDKNELELEDNQLAQHTKRAHSIELTCRVKKVNDIPYVDVTPWDHPRAKDVKASFAEWQGVFKCSQDLSIWFSQTVVPWCNGVATRARGGSYYILKGEALNRMVKVSKALDDVSHAYTSKLAVGESTVTRTRVEQGGRVILKPEVASQAAVEILIDNFVAECDRVCDAVGKVIAPKGKDAKPLGHKALDTQTDIATAQVAKLELFEAALDTRLDDLRDRLAETQSTAGLAALNALED